MNSPVNPNPLARIRQDIQSMQAYAIQESAGLVKLDAMENPFPLPLELQAELGRRLGAVAINRYPGARIDELKRALERYVDLPAGHALMLGNGSDELISLLAMGCDLPGASLLAPLPGFVMYAMSAQLQGLAFHGVPLTADFALDEAAMRAAMRAHQPAITYLAYPNNPTANRFDPDVMRRLIAEAARFGGLVVVDEAYQPFSSHTWLDEMRVQPEANAHVLLMRTLSKFGLAGVRIGYLLGPAALVHEFDKLRPPYNVSVLNAECALFALEHAEVFAQQAGVIREQREALMAALARLPGVQAFASEANMVLVRVPDAQRAFDGLKARGLLVKNVSKMHPLLAQCLRLTVGTPDENARLIQALQTAI
ncbi:MULTISPECIES: histidinol-phosphate transaminase [unclassified Hydrogenophaga]|uniref:histidinol-phosphate transaminase n=1 Tax=unclassified Hydrogenophaga TaxID=2610897 RepID=UPI0008791F61|nr:MULTISPECIES: histidinol-phosphate transaminase [unclassified Hydrogenophaga]MBN9372188.1 histidinol-phosphate transaminase [Hydrogenophaga sp.]